MAEFASHWNQISSPPVTLERINPSPKGFDMSLIGNLRIRVLAISVSALSLFIVSIAPSAQAAEPAVPGQTPARTTAPGTYVNLANSAGPAVPYQAPTPEAPTPTSEPSSERI